MIYELFVYNGYGLGSCDGRGWRGKWMSNVHVGPSVAAEPFVIYFDKGVPVGIKMFTFSIYFGLIYANRRRNSTVCRDHVYSYSFAHASIRFRIYQLSIILWLNNYKFRDKKYCDTNWTSACNCDRLYALCSFRLHQIKLIRFHKKMDYKSKREKWWIITSKSSELFWRLADFN